MHWSVFMWNEFLLDYSNWHSQLVEPTHQPCLLNLKICFLLINHFQCSLRVACSVKAPLTKLPVWSIWWQSLNSFLTSISQARAQWLSRQAKAANSLGVTILHQGYYCSSSCASVLMGCYAGHILFMSTCIAKIRKLKDMTQTICWYSDLKREFQYLIFLFLYKLQYYFFTYRGEN